MVRRTLIQGGVISLAGLGLGLGAWWLTGQASLALPLCVLSTVVPLSWLRRRDDARLREAARITERQHIEQELHVALERERQLRERNQAFIQRILNVIPDPFYIKDKDGRFIMVNDVFARDRGRTPESMIGMVSTSAAMTPELARDTAREDAAVLQGSVIDKEQHYIVPATGEERYRVVSKRPCLNMDNETVIVVAHFNITRWKVAERKLERMAHEDELTGLPNRRHFLAEAERLTSSAIRHGTPLSLILFDIDHFKQINDQYGHGIGDEVLKEVSRRLKAWLRSEDVPCRWGGEEFVVLMPLTELPMAETAATRLREAFANTPIAVTGLSLTVTVSGGVVRKRENESLDECLSRADKALYAAKGGGRNRFLAA
ncbi:MAG: diguanylate cyclase [Rhodocyclaceae bacterium]